MAATVLITGAGGLIGSWTLRHWDRASMHPVPLTRKDVDLLVEGEPTALVERLRPAGVVHLAWCASRTPGYRHSPDNDRWMTASLELHRACRAHGVRFWGTGSVVDEQAAPSDAYTAAKVELRHRLADAIDAGEIGWLRPTYVFDEEDRSPAVVEMALSAAERGEEVELATPDASHDFVHASDVGAAVATAVSHDLRGLVPIGSGRSHRVADLVEALGVAWRPSCATLSTTSHAGNAADVSRLKDAGWSPVRTESVFG